MEPTGQVRAQPARQLSWIAFGLAAAALFISAWLKPWTIDDAYIYMRYAENLAAGNGLVFNLGERVEGFTSPAWIFLLSLGASLTPDLEPLAKILGIAFSLGSLLLLANAHRFAPELDPALSGSATLLVGSSSVFTAWAVGGMDAPAVGFWGLLCTLLHIRSMREPGDTKRAMLVGGVCGLGLILRPELSLVAAVLFADRLLEDARHRTTTVLFFAMAAAAVYLPFFAWRLDYYGYLLPNTFYVKVGTTSAQIERGLRYVACFAWVSAPLIVPIVIATTLPRQRSDLRRYRVAGVLGGVLIIQTAFIISVGGDAMPAFRFYSVILPLMGLLSAIALHACVHAARIRRIALAIIIVANLLASSLALEFNDMIEHSRQVSATGKEVGLWMRETMPPDTVIALNAAGAVPYYSRLRTIDMLGLTDVHIAHREMPDMGLGPAGHEKSDGAYVLAARPDYIQFGSTRGHLFPYFPGDHEIARHPDFKKHYQRRHYTMESGEDIYLHQRKPGH